MFQSPQICYRDRYPCKGSENKIFFLNTFIIKNGRYDPKKLAIGKIFVQFWSSFYMGLLKICYSLTLLDWCLFSIFRVYLWRNTRRYIKNNVCSRKQKGCTSLSMIFLSFGSKWTPYKKCHFMLCQRSWKSIC